MSEKKPVPNIVDRNIKSCPVCGERSYSLEGIHPQCAAIQADAPRKKRLDAEKKAKAISKRIASDSALVAQAAAQPNP